MTTFKIEKKKRTNSGKELKDKNILKQKKEKKGQIVERN
jgi:hypothetical protein